jgi:hypothetical protein
MALALVIGAVKLIVSLNEQYKGQGQPLLPTMCLTFSLLEGSIYIVTTDYRFNLITVISINIRITVLMNPSSISIVYVIYNKKTPTQELK